MSITSAFRVALAALFVNKGRSILTSLGIVIGICAVIAMVAAGTGAKEKLEERLDSVGKNLILIQPNVRNSLGLSGREAPLNERDVQALRDDAKLKPLVLGFAESQHMATNASSATYTHRGTITGGVPEIRTIRGWTITAGRFYDQADLKKAAPVCLIGETVRKKLFPHKTNPVGERIKIEGLSLEVIGLMGEKGKAPTGADQDNQVFVPLTTMQQKLAHQKRLSVVVTTAKNAHDIPEIERRIREILRETRRVRPGQDDDFQVSSVQEMAQLAVFLTNTLNILIVVIASISLVVGGIGIMNIMLVSVTERTREIGIRMAVGARPRDIRNQFLLEAVVLALMGGVIGVSLGIGMALALGYALNWPVFISPFYVGLAFGVSAIVGVFFGFYPAAKASRLDPIEALRYE
jgi:putative ABC transport system permease protein